jgi:SAM-dependent methyltransferase
MSLFYKIAYSIGLKPWEEMAALPISRQISSLFDREETERQSPYGRALDLGCGTGIWTVELARRGWQVTGVDIIAKALRAARRRIEQAGVEAELIQGNLTALQDAGVSAQFNFVLDFGAIHGLNEAQRKAAAREVSALTVAGSTLLLLAWVPARRGPLPRGMSREELRTAFDGWQIIDEQIGDVRGAPGFVRKAEPRFYRLRRA